MRSEHMLYPQMWAAPSQFFQQVAKTNRRRKDPLVGWYGSVENLSAFVVVAVQETSVFFPKKTTKHILFVKVMSLFETSFLFLEFDLVFWVF